MVLNTFALPFMTGLLILNSTKIQIKRKNERMKEIKKKKNTRPTAEIVRKVNDPKHLIVRQIHIQTYMYTLRQ